MEGPKHERIDADMEPRIVTLTLNPAVDIACMAEQVVPTHKIRTTDERTDPGGGGINVARVVHMLGGRAHAVIMTGDVTGRLVEEMLEAAGVPWQSVPIAGRTRIAMNVHDRQSGLEYRFVPEGPEIAQAEWRAMLALLEVIEADWVVASGSLPRGVPANFYAQAAAIARRRGQHFALDTSGPALHHGIGAGITLLKMSLGEFESLVGHKVADPVEQEREIQALIDAGKADAIAVSLGADGAVLGTRAGIWRRPAVPVTTRSTVGAGDSFLAGLVLGMARGLSSEDALEFAMAVGAASVVTYGTAHVQRSDVEALYQSARKHPWANATTGSPGGD
jgi:6-phosphofructokinase 2